MDVNLLEFLWLYDLYVKLVGSAIFFLANYKVGSIKNQHL